MVIHDVRSSADGWSLNIDALTDGPDGFAVSGMPSKSYTPADGERFFRLRISLRNDGPGPREFNFDRCDLDDGRNAIVPALIATAPITVEADRASKLRSGESVERWLVFSYPRNRSPTRLSCAPMVIRLPPIPTR
jgi:hypothetical protein